MLVEARRVVGFVLALSAGTLPALAQSGAGGPVTPGTWAGGVDIGFSNPIGDDDFGTELLLGGHLEYFQTERVSWRGMLAYRSHEGPAGIGDADLLALNANLVYRWPATGVRPFVTGGLGAYRYDPDPGGTDVEFGVDFGGGADLPLVGSPNGRPKIAIKLEGLFHGTSGREPDSFFDGTVGIRFYW